MRGRSIILIQRRHSASVMTSLRRRGTKQAVKPSNLKRYYAAKPRPSPSWHHPCGCWIASSHAGLTTPSAPQRLSWHLGLFALRLEGLALVIES